MKLWEKVYRLKHDRHVLDAPAGYWQKRFLAFLIILIFIGAVGYFSRGWIRKTFLPKAVQAVEARNLQKQTETEIDRLQYPFETLTYNNISRAKAACMLDSAEKFTTDIYCSSTVEASSLQLQDSNRINLTTAAIKIENLLKQNHWIGEYSDGGEYTSLHRVFTGVGIDKSYSQTAAYYKIVGNSNCSFQVSVFYDKTPATVNTRLSCSRNYKLVGVIF